MDDIETITLTPSGPNRWKLVTPAHARATLDDAAVVESGLASGDPWTPAVQERVRRAIGEAGCRLAAARLLRVRPRSTGELRERLAKRYPKQAVARTIDGLTRSGVLDDARLADQLAEQLGERRPHAHEAVRARLERADVGDHQVERALEAHAPRESEAERAMAAARMQIRRLEPMGLSEQAVRRRLFGALARRGFDAETAAEAIDHVLGPGREDEVDALPDAMD